MQDLAERLAQAVEGRYRLDHVVGRGGMSVVYQAQDLRHDRPVAIKVFTETVGQGSGERFLREIGFLARLHHPHILSLLDSGTSGGLLYYVMPFVEGESLRERMTRDPRLPVQDTVRLLLEVCDALRYAHAQGIVHRDIKPENILLVDRHAVVADFGVARAVHKGGATASTTAGLAIGTPTYMSPEQAAADPNVDHRADLYALGIVAYELLAGRPPFVAESQHLVLAAHVTATPDDLATLRPDLPPGLCAAVMRCLAKRPDERWPDAGALREALEPFLLPSGAMTPVGTAPYSGRKRRIQVIAAGVGAILMLALALRLSPTSRAIDLSLGEPRRLGVSTELELDPSLSADGRMLAYTTGELGALRVHVRQLSGGQPIAVAADVAGSQRRPRWSPDGATLAFQAGGAVHAVPSLGGAARVLVEGTPDRPAGDFTWSPDGTRVAWIQAGAILIRPAAGGEPVELARDIGAHSLAWSPDGRWLAYVSGNIEFTFSETLLGNIAPSRLMLLAAAGGEPLALTDGRTLAASPVWMDQRTIAYVAGGGATRDIHALRISRRGTAAGTPVRLTTGLKVHALALAPDGQSLVYVILNHVANVWSVPLPYPGEPVATMAAAEPVTEGDQVVEDMDVLPGGGWLLFDSNRGGSQDIWLQSGRASAPVQLTSDPGDEFGPVWSPSGREVAYYAVRDGIRHLFVMRATGQEAVQVTADSLQDQQPKWSPDGNSLVFYRRDGAGRDRLFVTTRGEDSTWSTPRLVTEEYGTAADWSSDGRWIAFVDPEGNLRVVEASGGTSRIVARPEEVGGLPLRRPHWLWGELALLVRAEGPRGTGGIWRISLMGEAPAELVRLDDAGRPVYRTDLAADRDRVYLLVSEFSTSLWRIPVEAAMR